MFPTENHSLARRFAVPADLISGRFFTVVIIPWRIPTGRYKSLNWRREGSSIHDRPSPEAPLAELRNSKEQYLVKNSVYHRALFLLEFPDWLREFMSRGERPFCIWWNSGDEYNNQAGLETRLLHVVLSRCGKAEDGGHKIVRGYHPRRYQIDTLFRLSYASYLYILARFQRCITYRGSLKRGTSNTRCSSLHTAPIPQCILVAGVFMRFFPWV